MRNDNYVDIMSRIYQPKFDITDEEISKRTFQTLDVTFQVTDACNLKCSYCYQINKGNHVMSLDTAKKFIDLLIDNDENTRQYMDTSKSDAVILDFIGGEPFLQVELIDQILEYFQKQIIEKDHPWQYNWRISISSNGTLYFDPKVQNFLKKYRDFISLSISIDGNKELHDSCRVFPDGSGSYDIAIKAVHHYIDKLGGSMGSKMTLAPENIQYTYEAVKSLIEEGYDSIFLNCIFEKGWTNEHATILYHELIKLADYILMNNLEDKVYVSMFEKIFFRPKEPSDNVNWCGGNGRMIAVDYKGDIYPCIRYMESSLGTEIEPIKCGNVNDGIMTTDKCRNCINLLKSVNRINQSTQECIDCPIAEGCAWCQAYNYQDSGTFFHRATYICCMHKARSLANAYYWNLMYWKNKEDTRFKIYLSDEEALKIITPEELEELKIYQYPLE